MQVADQFETENVKIVWGMHLRTTNLKVNATRRNRFGDTTITG